MVLLVKKVSYSGSLDERNLYDTRQAETPPAKKAANIDHGHAVIALSIADTIATLTNAGVVQ